MSIETLDDWNTRLGYCGCCGMPECPTPTLVCESKYATARWDTGSEGEQYEENLEAWETDRDEWVAVDPDNRNPWDYPVDRPEIPENTLYGTWVQYDRPVGDDEDPMPAIYRKTTDNGRTQETVLYTGETGSKIATNDWYYNSVSEDYVAAYSTSCTRTKTYASDPPPGPDSVKDAVEGTYGNYGEMLTCEATENPTFVASLPTWNMEDLGGFLPDPPTSVHAGGVNYPWVEENPKKYEVIAGTTVNYDSGSATVKFGTTQAADACPGPWGQPQGGDYLVWRWADLSVVGAERSYTLGDPMTREDMAAENVAALDDIQEWSGGGCVAHFNISWRFISDFDWTIPESRLYKDAFKVVNLRRALPSSNMTKVRSRFRIPESHLGSYFKITYDIVEIPDGWDAMIDDPEYVVPDPPTGDPVPQVPKPGRPERSFVSQDNVVTWTGPGTPVPDPIIEDDEQSPDFGEVTNQVAIDAAEATWLTPWFEIPPPTVEGERRVVNIRFTCYHGTKYGVKPQVTGEALELP